MSTETIAARRFVRTTAEGEYLIADAKLDHIQGNAHPYFSLTGEIWESERHYVRRTHHETGLLTMGAIADEIVAAFAGDPLADEIAHIAAMHLADDDGAPMYADENGWYWYTRDRETAARHLRVPLEELPDDLARGAFTEYVDAQRPRWKEDAARALAFLNDTH